MTLPHWQDDPAAWNRLTIASAPGNGVFPEPQIMPGVWDIDTTCRRKIDHPKAKGVDRSKLRDQGYENARLDLVGRLVTHDDWEKLQRILPLIHPRKAGLQRNVLVIQHPKAELMGISQVYVEEVRAPRIVRGILEITIRAIQYIETPKPVKQAKKGSVKLTQQDQLLLQQLSPDPATRAWGPPPTTDKGPYETNYADRAWGPVSPW